jgi:hypothetical protein
MAARAHDIVLVAVSAGKQCEEHARKLWQEDKPDEYFFLEIYGSAVVEYLIASAGFRLCAWADSRGVAVLPHYSPGYPGWDISDQGRLLSLIRYGKAYEFPEELGVMHTGMLQPKKSLLAAFGITSHLESVRHLSELIPCENCSLPSCQYRRAPYKNFLPQTEDVRHLQSGTDMSSHAGSPGGKILDLNAQYSISRKALRKWSQEQLELKVMNDRSVEALFRYEGTTCSNMGRPLEFHYYVRLGPPDSGYRILDTRCLPAPGDTGHQHMCEFQDNPQALFNSIAHEKPLLGRPLNDVFTWERRYDPSGCYCTEDGREHKWGLVFEVLHYALAEYEESNNNS